MVNVIYRGDKKIDLTSFNKITTYDLTDIRFFIPNTKGLSFLYCVFKDKSGNMDSVELSSVTCEQKNYFCYTFNIEQSLSIKSGELTLFLFGIYGDNSTIITDEFIINLNVENFNIANQLYLINKLDNNILNYYNKIVQLTEMNVNIISDMKELKEGGIIE